MNKNFAFETRAIHAGEQPDMRAGASGDVAAPIHLSTTFARHEVDHPTGGYEYTRSLNPTRFALETKLAAIEDAQYGLAFSSGLAAETAIIMGLLKSGDHVVASDDLYGGTKRLFNKVMNEFGITASYADVTDMAAFEKALTPDTRMIWVETVSNPLLKIANIKGLAAIARQHHVILVVDNTFLSPYFMHPLALGADIVMHSATKYIGGHSDVLGGVVMTDDAALYEKIQYYQNAAGAVMPPFDSYIVMRGIKTLSLRMERHGDNALKVAEYLENSPKVSRVLYPGLPSFPQRELHLSQACGNGGIITFEIKGTIDDAKRFLSRLQVIALAESLGGVESLVELPSLMTHSSVAPEERAKIGITDTLVRLSVGIENVDDLIADFEQALQ
ncbi:MAG: PLP-dependent transferase [Paludibacteraceae bacterium]|nr:PLP-dependent transferase [Paludibacteraceae bacterium]